MGIYSEYLDAKMNFQQLTSHRKRQLRTISKIRGGRDILVYAADLTSKAPASISIDYSDILPFQDQLANLKGNAIDVILETPGGFAEVVEELVSLLRSRYKHVGIIIPGSAKSAGTIFAMAGDEILMGPTSSLGPIDAQIMFNNKRFSADAFLDGLEKMKAEVAKSGKLNAAYIPILQNISPGEIQHCENAQRLSRLLVTKWLSQYKFQDWDKHSSTGAPVTQKEKEERAEQIASKLCKQSDWLTHARSIKIPDLQKMRLKITDYSLTPVLNDAITRYYTLLRMTLESTNIYKIIETADSQIMRFLAPDVPVQQSKKEPSKAFFNFECPKCKSRFEIQADLDKKAPLEPGKMPYPKNDNFVCPNCHTSSNLSRARLQIEARLKRKVVS